VPIIEIQGMPHETDKEALRHLRSSLRQAVIGIGALELTDEKQVTLKFPSDLLDDDGGLQLIVTIKKLYAKKKRTSAVRQRVADTVGGIVKDFIRANTTNPKLLEVFVEEPYKATNGVFRFEF